MAPRHLSQNFHFGLDVVECRNYGTEVDEIDNMPHDNIKGDKQLDKGIELVLKDLKNKDSVLRPDFSKTDLKLP